MLAAMAAAALTLLGIDIRHDEAAAAPRPPAPPPPPREALSRAIERYNADDKYRQQVAEAMKMISSSIGSMILIRELTSGP